MKQVGIILLCLLSSIGVFGQELVKDFTDTVADLDEEITRTPLSGPCKGLVFFTNEDAFGRELWKTDGTAEGTQLVVDLYPGSESGFQNTSYGFLQCLSDQILFIGSNDEQNRRLFSTDGTQSGTSMITDIGLNGGYTLFKNQIVISEGSKVWLGDLSGSFSLIKEFDYGEGLTTYASYLFGGSSSIYWRVEVRNEDSSPVRWEIWKSDGTEQGTVLIREFPFDDDYFYGFEEAGPFIYFSASGGINGNELWKTDGTPEGTEIGYNLTPNKNEGAPSIIGQFNNKLLYDFNTSLGDRTYLTNGTEEGTNLIFEGGTLAAKEFDGFIYGTAYSSVHDEYVLYKSDGTQLGTEILNTLGSDFLLYPWIHKIDDKLIISAGSSEEGVELHYSLGVADDIMLLKDIYPGSNSSFSKSLLDYNDNLIFAANDGIHGTELWSTDGTEGGTNMILDLRTGTKSSVIDEVVNLNDKIYFKVGTSLFLGDLWSTDGTSVGTSFEEDFFAFFILGKSDNDLLIYESRKFWRVNVITNEKSFVHEIGISSGYGPGRSSVKIGDNLYFDFRTDGLGTEKWKWNTLDNSIGIIKDIFPGPGTSVERGPGGSNYPGRAAALGDNLIFPADDGVNGTELWMTDGTELGTQIIKDISADSSNPVYVVEAGGQVYFGADDGVHGAELWKSDGTSGGTTLVKDIHIENGSDPSLITRFGNKVIFVADDGVHGSEPWISDGTSEGTVLLQDINPSGNSNAVSFYEFNNKIFFTANDGLHGAELWITDGTQGGTVMVDLVDGEEGSSPYRFIDDGSNLFFQANRQVWRSGGSAPQVEMIGDFEPHSEFYVVNDYLCFTYYRDDVGRELFRIPINNFEKWSQQIDFPVVENQTIGNTSFELSATATSDLEIVFTSQSDKITIDGNEVTLVKAGQVTIHADQPGDDIFDSAPTASQTFCINPAQPTITLSGDPAQPVLTSSSTEGNLWYRDDVILDETTTSLSATESGTYTLQVVIDGCESELSEGKTILITGVEEGTLIEVHPNPTSGTINISIDNEQTVQILNGNGAILFDEVLSAGEHQLNISGYPSGVYILKLISSTGTEVKRWVKQ